VLNTFPLMTSGIELMETKNLSLIYLSFWRVFKHKRV